MKLPGSFGVLTRSWRGKRRGLGNGRCCFGGKLCYWRRRQHKICARRCSSRVPTPSSAKKRLTGSSASSTFSHRHRLLTSIPPSHPHDTTRPSPSQSLPQLSRAQLTSDNQQFARPYWHHCFIYALTTAPHVGIERSLRSRKASAGTHLLLSRTLVAVPVDQLVASLRWRVGSGI